MKKFFEDYGLALSYFGFIIICFTLLFVLSTKENQTNEQIYTNIMNEEYQFIDNIILQENSKYSHKTLYKIIYKDNENVQEVNLNIQQYYNIITKFKQ